MRISIREVIEPDLVFEQMAQAAMLRIHRGQGRHRAGSHQEEEDAWGSGGDREERRVSRFWTYLKERITGSGDGNPTVLGEVDGGQHQV